MIQIMVVDDSPVDRRLVGGILEKQEDWTVEYAEDGEHALERLPTVDPDLIVTDLQMPRRNGLELVVEVTRRYPSIPMVLVTSQGSEDIAIQALRAGASSYTPKRLISQDLVETVRQVLSAAGYRRRQTRVLHRLTDAKLSFCLESESTLIGPVVEVLQEYLASWTQADRVRFGVAVNEALVNSMYHGNLEISSDLKESDDQDFYALVQQRSSQEPYQSRRLSIEAHYTQTQVQVVMTDQGPGFDPESLPDPTDPENLERVSGRGLLLIRTFMDEVSFNSKGNQITMIKHKSPLEPSDCQQSSTANSSLRD